MFDHLMNFADEATAKADPVVGRYWLADPDLPAGGAWRGDVCIPGLAVYQVTGTQAVTDPTTGQTYQQDIRQPYPGWWIAIALPALDPALQADAGCVLITDRGKAAAGEPGWQLYAAPSVTPQDLAATRVEPTFAGSNYPFGAG